MRNERLNKSWPHSPAIISKIEEYADDGSGRLLRSYWKVTLNGEERHVSSYETAVREAGDMSWWQGYAGLDAGVPVATIAEELAA